MFQNQNPNNNNNIEATVGAVAPMPLEGATEQLQQSINYNGVQPIQQNKGVRKKPYVKITVQPASKALRFRYECEGRSAGSIPGVDSTPENKTYPTIEIVGYKGRAVVVVSCVTKDPPYRPHPHNLVGKEGCKKGVCTLEINSETMRAVFSNLGIQCVKKKDIEAALKAREDIRVDPFKTGFAHRSNNSSIDLNVVRLCFQVFMESEQKGRFTQPLPPVVSDPIYDKKAMSDLVICRLCTCSATVLGNTQIILLCEKVAKDDISVRFYEEKNQQVVWEAYGEFQSTDVHKQTAITFKTPRYHTLDITEPAKVFIQLRRPSDGVTSEPLPFEYTHLDSGRHTYWSLRRNLKRKPDLELFQEILNLDSEQSNQNENQEQEHEQATLIANNNHIVTDLDEPSLNQEPLAMPTADEFLNSTEIMQTDDLAMMQSQQQEIDEILDEKVRELQAQQIHDETMIVDEQQQQQQPQQQQEVEHVLEFPPQIGTTDKINEWMKYNESQTATTNGQKEQASLLNDDKTLNELLEQVVELDEIYSDHVHRRDSQQQQQEQQHQSFLDRGESFDDAATYTSLQIAFKHPVDIPIIQQLQPPPQQQQQPIIEVEEKKLPPLPPKRKRVLDAINNENEPLETNHLEEISQTPLIIMKTPERVPSPRGSIKSKSAATESNTCTPKPKKSGFFSKIFARRKSKADNNSKVATPLGSREASIQHFPLNDTHRVSARSVQSLQANSLPTSPTKVSGKPKSSKPVGRSVSSVSGKRPAHLNAEVIHIPLKGESVSSLPQQEAYSHASTITLDRRTVSALQLADIPINEGNMELVAIADRQSLRNLCEGELNIHLDPNVDLTEAEHFALYTSVPPQATVSEFDENSAYYAAVDAGEILTPNEIAKRLTAANRPK